MMAGITTILESFTQAAIDPTLLWITRSLFHLLVAWCFVAHHRAVNLFLFGWATREAGNSGHALKSLGRVAPLQRDTNE